MKKNNLSLGVSLCLGGTFSSTVISAIIKEYAHIFPPMPVVVFLLSGVAFFLMLPFIFFNNKNQSIQKTLKTTHIWLHITRSITGFIMMITMFYAVTYMPLVNAVLLSNTAPLIVPFIGYLFFSQKLNHRLWLPLLAGYVGVVIILSPDSNSNFLEVGSLLAITSAVALAFTIHIVSKIAKDDSIKIILFYFLLFTTITAGLVTIPFWQTLSATSWMWMLLLGVLFFVSQYFGNAAMLYANPQLIGALMYSNVLFSAIFTVIIWKTVPSLGMTFGMLLVILGGIGCIWVEYKEGKPKKRST